MHISEGVAPIHIAIAGAVIAAPCVAAGLGRLKDEHVPRAAIMASVLFVSTIVVRLPIGPSSVHPLLGGLTGILLGWISMPVFLVSLFLQALLFQFGGVTTLGINTVVMGLPAVAAWYICRTGLRDRGGTGKGFLWGFIAGASAYMLSFGLWTLALVLCGSHLKTIAQIALIPNAAVAVVEGIFTGFVARFLIKVYPSIFAANGGAMRVE
ncbi:MAG TPA: CbiM family transporter, partial [Candidatus Krumholzibacterium sp.]|nr:CbiM family transporter [Candidatus Krumholzibacterium sp.]